MGTSSTDRYVDPITSYDDAIFDYIALHEVGASENRMLGPHTGCCGVNNLTTNVVATLGLRTAVKGPSTSPCTAVGPSMQPP